MPPSRRVATAILVIVTAAAGCVRSTPPATPPTPPPSSAAQPAAQPADLAAALLTPTDFTTPDWQPAPQASHAPNLWHLDECPSRPHGTYPAQAHRTETRLRTYVGRRHATVTNVVERFAAGWGPRGVADTRRMLGDCARFQTADRMLTHTVIDGHFAGDESVLVKSVEIIPPAGDQVSWTAVVRCGDLVSTVAGAGLTAEQVRELATRAAHRLT